MKREEIKKKALSIIRACVPDLAEAKIEEGSNINTDASVDSMSFIYLMTQIEAGFGIQIPQKKWAKLSALCSMRSSCAFLSKTERCLPKSSPF